MEKELKEKIRKILEDSREIDWVYNGEDEVGVELFNTYAATRDLYNLFVEEMAKLK